ncbi:MAG: DUF2299 family protein [Methanobrevibacter sp.]|jgi:hypothetical protein|nr:DUF2299 family protein [Methanobrevibacter sp.]
MINEKKVQKWLTEEGFFKEKIHDENSKFHFLVQYPDDNLMDLFQPKGKGDLLVIGCATNVSPEHLEIIKNVSMNKKIDIIWNFKYTVNQFLLDFQIDHPDNIIRGFVITNTLYEDGLNKNNLIFEIKKIFKAKLQCLLIMEKVLNSPDFVNDIKDNSKLDDSGMFR